MDFGIDSVIYSATKYYAGFHNEYMTFGNILASQNAWLMLRSLRTLPIRLKQPSENIQETIQYLNNSPKIERIWYPFQESNPQLDIAHKQMKMPMFTIAFKKKNVSSIKKFCESLQNF